MRGLTTRVQDIAISTAYKFWLPGAQTAGSGNVVDGSGNGNDGVLEAGLSDANCWATAGYFSSIAGTASGIAVPNAASDYDLSAKESLIFSTVINGANLAVSAGIIGNTLGPGPGYRLVRGGGVTFSLSDGTNFINSVFGTSAALLNSTDQTLTAMVDGLTNVCYLFLNGVFVLSTSTAAVTGSTASTHPFVFGSDSNPGTGNTYAFSYRDANTLVFGNDSNGDPLGLPTNIIEIAKLIHSRRGIPLSVKEVGI